MNNVIKQLTPEQAKLVLQGDKGLEQAANQLKPPYNLQLLNYRKYYSQPQAQKLLQQKSGANQTPQGQTALPSNAKPVRPKAAAFANTPQVDPNAQQAVNNPNS